MHEEVAEVCVRAYLEQARHARIEIDKASDAVRRQRERVEGPASSEVRIRRAGNVHVDKIADGLVKLEELRAALDTALALNAPLYYGAKDLCRPTGWNRYVLWMKRVEGLTWDAIARAEGISTATCRRAARKGVMELYRLMPEEFRRDSIPNAAPR